MQSKAGSDSETGLAVNPYQGGGDLRLATRHRVEPDENRLMTLLVCHLSSWFDSRPDFT